MDLTIERPSQILQRTYELTVGIIKKGPNDNTAAFKNQTVEILSESLNENFSQAKKKLYPQKLTAQAFMPSVERKN